MGRAMKYDFSDEVDRDGSGTQGSERNVGEVFGGEGKRKAVGSANAYLLCARLQVTRAKPQPIELGNAIHSRPC